MGEGERSDAGRGEQRDDGAGELRNDQHRSIELLESLRRISQALGSGLELETVLQGIVDAVSDHTQWHVCWINEAHVSRSTLEVVARRDKIAYTVESRKRVWDLHGSPSIDALRTGEAIAMENVDDYVDEYPEYVLDAKLRGTRTAVTIPLNTLEPGDVPRVLSVQSDVPLLEDTRQLAFLRTVASLASVAVRKAQGVAASRRELLHTTEGLSLVSFVMERLARSLPSEQIFEQIEQRIDASLVMVDSAGSLRFVGRSPIGYELDDEAWRDSVKEGAEALHRMILAAEHEAPGAGIAMGEIHPAAASLSSCLLRLSGEVPNGHAVLIGRSPLPQGMLDAVASVLVAPLLRDQERFRVEQELKVDALKSLFSAESAGENATVRRAEAIGIDLFRPTALVLLREREAPRVRAATVQFRMSVSAAVHGRSGATVHPTDDGLVVFLPTGCEEHAAVSAEVHALFNRRSLGAHAERAIVTWAGPCSSPEDYPAAWAECRSASELAAKLRRRGPAHISDFGAYRFLLSALGEQEIGEYIEQTLGGILAYDRQNSGELLRTLESYLHSGARLQQTARELHIHVSTLRYRLDRIRTITEIDLSDEQVRFDASLAIRLLRLRQDCAEGDE